MCAPLPDFVRTAAAVNQHPAPSVAAAQESNDRLNQIVAERDALHADVQQLQEQLRVSTDAHQNECQALRSQAQDMQTALEDKESALDQLAQENKQLTEQAAQVPELTATISGLRQSQTECQVSLKHAVGHPNTPCAMQQWRLISVCNTSVVLCLRLFWALHMYKQRGKLSTVPSPPPPQKCSAPPPPPPQDHLHLRLAHFKAGRPKAGFWEQAVSHGHQSASAMPNLPPAGGMVFSLFGGCRGGRTVRCAESRLFSTAGSHGTQGPECCTPDAGLNGSCTLL